MIAVEFETHVAGGMIRVPNEYTKMLDGDMKVILLKEEEKPEALAQQKKSNLKKLLKKIQGKNIFRSINDPVEWQRTLRNEWQ